MAERELALQLSVEGLLRAVIIHACVICMMNVYDVTIEYDSMMYNKACLFYQRSINAKLHTGHAMKLTYSSLFGSYVKT